MRNETLRTVVYLAVAAVAGVLGYVTYRSNQPQEAGEFEKVGQEFYADFNNPNDADSLEVYVFDDEKAKISDFRVESKDGRWRIPSHYNYPADAKEQLAKTAASIIGIKRTALASRLESDFERLGVIDPTLTDSAKLTGRGSRITLKKGGAVLADYIIGKPFPDGEGKFYVRAPQEKETYIAQFNVDLSTEFKDWIDTDLLKIEQDKLTDIIVNKYTLDETEGRLKDVDVTDIHREKFGEAWKIADLDLEKEEVNSDAVKDLVSALVGIEILGVRPKPEGLAPDLTLTKEASRNPLLRATIQGDLAERGFFLAQRESGGLSVIAKEGSFYAATNEGIVYELHFGEVFTGSLKEIEIGSASKKKLAEGDTTGTDETKEPAKEEAVATEDDPESSIESISEDRKPSRYLFIKVEFDDKYLGPEPVKPEPPAEPKESEPAAADVPLVAPKPGDEEPPDPVANYEILKKKYEDDLKKYQQELKSREERKQTGVGVAKQLNDRLGAWYYVVSAENVDSLRVKRETLVQPAGTDAKEAEKNPPHGGGLPQGLPQGLPNLPPGLNLPEN